MVDEMQDRMRKRRQQGSPALPPIRCEAIRRLVRLMATLEAVEDGSYVPGAETVGAVPLRLDECHGMVTNQLGCTITNIALAVKRIVDYPIGDWDADPLVIMRESQLKEFAAGRIAAG